MTKLKPYEFQEEDIARTISLKRVINGNEMGTGKSLEAIVSVERAHATPCLVICPASLKVNWERETMRFTNLRPLILTDSVKATFPYFIGTLNLYDVVIVNYESLKKYFVVSAPKPYRMKDIIFQNVISQFKSVIIDESQRIKDPSALQSKLTMGICKDKEYVIELTGTPVVNDPKDLASQIAILGRMKEFGGYSEFLNNFGDGNNTHLLQKQLYEKCYFRREKKEVLKDLPDLTRSTVITEIDNRDEYDACENDLRSYLAEYKQCSEAEIRKKMRMAALVKFMNLRKIATMGKISAAVEFLNNTSEQVVVFCEHHDVVDALKEAFPDAVCVTGRQNQREKQAAIDSFQSGKRRIIICSIRAAGVGLTLTAASNELFVSLPWHFADLTQCEARCWRNSQKNAVNSWILIGENTIDSRLYKLIMDKKSIAHKITGANDEALENQQYFDELVTSFLYG